jgi:hypothetical protein
MRKKTKGLAIAQKTGSASVNARASIGRCGIDEGKKDRSRSEDPLPVKLLTQVDESVQQSSQIET